MTATYTKLKSGEWGIRVEGTVKAGQVVTVTKKSGEKSTETVVKVVWSGNGISLCAVKVKTTAGYASKTSGSRGSAGSLRGKRTGCACGSIEGEYHDWYCSTCRFDELDQ